MKKETVCFLHTDHTQQIAVHESDISMVLRNLGHRIVAIIL